MKDDLTARTELFLKSAGVHPDCVDDGETFSRLLDEMRTGLASDSSSLAMLPTYLKAEGELPRGENVLVIDAGGTSLRTALVSFEEDGPRLKGLKVGEMPGSLSPVTRNEYEEGLIRAMAPFLDEADTIGYCFSYPALILPDRDARLLHFCKGVEVSGTDNMLVCAELAKALKKAGYPKSYHWVLLNDSPAAAFGGLVLAKDAGSSGLLGFILGTGMNICYSEKTAAIRRYPEAASFTGERMLISCESGGFDKLPLGTVDKALHAQDPQPGMYVLEKMCSGAYLGKLALLSAGEAARCGLFSDGAIDAIAGSSFTTKDIGAFIRGDFSGAPADVCKTEDDFRVLTAICEAVLRRAGKLSGIALAAVMEQAGIGRSREHPAIILAEGSTFWKAPLLKEAAKAELDLLAQKKGRGYYSFASAENVNIYGTAAAALLNRD